MGGLRRRGEIRPGIFGLLPWRERSRSDVPDGVLQRPVVLPRDVRRLGQPAFIYDLYEILTGEAYDPVEANDFFSFNVLYGAGHRPSVRSFSHRSPPREGNGRATENVVLYFDMLLGPDPERKETIVDYFRSHPNDEDDEGEEMTSYVVHWHPGPGDGLTSML